MQFKVISHVKGVWNSFDKEETNALAKVLRRYVDVIYVPPPMERGPEFGLKFVKDVLQAIIDRIK